MGGAHRDEDTAGERCRGPQDQTAGGIPRRLVGVLVVLGCAATHLRGGQEESAEGERECGRRPRVGHEGTVQADADVGGGPAARCGDEAEADQGDQAKRAVACRRHKRQGEDGAAEDAEGDRFEAVLWRGGHAERGEPGAGPRVRVHSPTRGGQGDPGRRVGNDRDVGGREDDRGGHGHDGAAAGAPQEGRQAKGQRPRRAARQDEEGQARTSGVNRSRVDWRGGDARSTGNHQRRGCRHAVGGQDGHREVRQGSGERAVRGTE